MCECKVVRKFALQTEKLMHSLCPTNRTNKNLWSKSISRAMYLKVDKTHCKVICGLNSFYRRVRNTSMKKFPLPSVPNKFKQLPPKKADEFFLN